MRAFPFEHILGQDGVELFCDNLCPDGIVAREQICSKELFFGSVTWHDFSRALKGTK
jgi:hypothetical protein